MKKLMLAAVAALMSMAVAGAYAADDKAGAMSKGDAKKSDTGMTKSEKGMAKSESANDMSKGEMSKDDTKKGKGKAEPK